MLIELKRKGNVIISPTKWVEGREFQTGYHQITDLSPFLLEDEAVEVNIVIHPDDWYDINLRRNRSVARVRLR